MKTKDLSLIFTAGVIAILFVVVDLLSYLFIEKGLLLIITAIMSIAFISRWLAGVLF